MDTNPEVQTETPKKASPPKTTNSNEEKAPDSSEIGNQKQKPNKSKKRKKPKDSTAPRHPLTGNHLFVIKIK